MSFCLVLLSVGASCVVCLLVQGVSLVLVCVPVVEVVGPPIGNWEAAPGTVGDGMAHMSRWCHRRLALESKVSLGWTWW